MRTWTLGILVLAFGFAQAALAQPTKETFTASAAAAHDWLAMLDASKYEDSWQQASRRFKGQVTQENWVARAKEDRAERGALVSRKQILQQPRTVSTGEPNSDYFVLIYEAMYKKKGKMFETLTIVKDQDGHWRLAAYFVK